MGQYQVLIKSIELQGVCVEVAMEIPNRIVDVLELWIGLCRDVLPHMNAHTGWTQRKQTFF